MFRGPDSQEIYFNEEKSFCFGNNRLAVIDEKGGKQPMFSEDKMVTTESENVDSVKNIEQEILQMMNDKAHPYHIKGHPEHDKSVQQMLTMREMLNSNTK